MNAEKDQITEVIDAKNLLCPLPVLKLRKALKKLKSGQLIEIMTTDPVAAIDIPHFCTQEGHELVKTIDNGSSHSFIIKHQG